MTNNTNKNAASRLITAAKEPRKEEEKFNGMVMSVNENKPDIEAIKIKFLTRDAVRLIDPEVITVGKRETYLPALKSFDTRLNKVLNAARQDDPFADQVLLDTELAIDEYNETLEEQTNSLRAQIRALFEFNEASLRRSTNTHAYTVNVSIRNRLSTQLLWSLKKLDTFLYLVFQAEKHCVISRQQAQIYKRESKKDYRAILTKISGWNQTSISRTDISQKTQRTLKAFEQNVQISLSTEVLLLQIRADCAPPISGRRNNHLDQETREKLLSIIRGDEGTESTSEEEKDLKIDSENAIDSKESTDKKSA